MRLLRSTWFVALVVAGLSASMAPLAEAQPVRDHRRRRPPPPPAPTPAPPTADSGPTEAPPSPREERIAARKGFVWIPGRWDWRGKWQWVAGHWERERAGKQWNDGRWEQRDSRWIYVAGRWVDATTPPPPPVAPPAVTPPPGGVTVASPPAATPPPGGWPATAPPPPREEKLAARAGIVWVPGQWDWRTNKWEWVAGHWERERAGKRWRPSRWEQREGRWARVDGDWIDDNGPPGPPGPGMQPPGQPGQPGMRPRPRREWKLERPVVSSYWPVKGKVGSRVVIKGRNFPDTTQVVFAGQPIRGVKIKDKRIVFVVPANATSGAIELRTGKRRALPVGMFEVAAAFDPVAEQRRLEQERRKRAEQLWSERQRELAKNRAAREAAMRKRWEERAATREQRRAERIAAIAARWQRAFLADESTQAELTLHAQRAAELERMRELAEIRANGKLVVRIEMLIGREDQRHQRRMTALEASFKISGGQP